MKNLRLSWGIQDKTYDAMRGTSGSLGEAALLFAYLTVWSLIMAAFLGAFVLTIMVSLLLVGISLPCFLWSNILSRQRSKRSGYSPNARPVR